MNEKKNVLKDKSFFFAIRIVNLYKHLQGDKKEFILSKQLLRSGTSIGANVREAYSAESKKDFIHKLSICQKETNEANYWLELLKATDYLSIAEFESVNKDSNELYKIITSSIITCKKNINI
jgi:four helix bundle protein